MFAAALLSAGNASAQSCDRSCLMGIADAYLAALVAHDPSKAPMAPNTKLTEQAQVTRAGEGVLWKYTTVVSPTFKLPVPDPIAGQIGMIVMLKVSGNAPGAPARGAAPVSTPDVPPDRDVQLALPLKVVNSRITEAEHIMATIGANSIANLQTPRPALLAALPQEQRTPRQFMLLIANAYYDSIVQTMVTPSLMPTTADGVRTACRLQAPALLPAEAAVSAAHSRAAGIRSSRAA